MHRLPCNRTVMWLIVFTPAGCAAAAPSPGPILPNAHVRIEFPEPVEVTTTDGELTAVVLVLEGRFRALTDSTMVVHVSDAVGAPGRAPGEAAERLRNRLAEVPREEAAAVQTTGVDVNRAANAILIGAAAGAAILILGKYLLHIVAYM